jgi:hypothetical protein
MHIKSYISYIIAKTFFFFFFFENQHSLINESSKAKLLQYRISPEVSVGKLQRYQRHTRRITI